MHFNNDWGQKQGQLAHLDRDSSNFTEDNLAFFCLPHHDDYDTKRRQTKNLTIREAKTARDRLYEFIETGGDLATVGQQTVPRPTLEATRDSTIVASGAVIPGDLPFQFARADSGSVISMAGIKVIKKQDGSFLVTPGNEPADTGGATFTNESQVEMLSRLSQYLCDARDLFQNLVRRVRFQGELSEAEYYSKCVKALASAQETVAKGRLLMTSDLINLCEHFFRKISQGLADFAFAQHPMVTNGSQRAAFLDKAAIIARDEIPAILEQIEELSRSLIHSKPR
jgi:hypothetical protein